MSTRLTASLLFGLSAGIFASAQPFHPGPPPPMFEVLKGLDLTETQKQSIHAILERRRDEHRNLQEIADSKEQALMDVLHESDTTEPQIQSLHAAVSDARLALLLDERATMLEIQTVLTPAQKVKAKALEAQFKKNMEEHRRLMGELDLPPMP